MSGVQLCGPNVLYTLTLDKLIREGKINKVPYSQKSGKWSPRVGDQCWSYLHDNMFTVVSVNSKAEKVIIRWGFEDEGNYQTIAIKDMPKANLVFKDYEIRLQDSNGEPTNPMTLFYRVIKGSCDETSIRGAEIKAWVVNGTIPYMIGYNICREYLANTAEYKISDTVYYFIELKSTSAVTLIRDLEKSPRNYDTGIGNNGDGISKECSHEQLLVESIESINTYAENAADMFVQYNIKDTMLQQEINKRAESGKIKFAIGKLISLFRGRPMLTRI